MLDSTEFAQPALFAVEVASFAVLRDWGVLPDFVMGHPLESWRRRTRPVC